MNGRQIIYVERVYAVRETAHIADAMTLLIPEDGDDLSVDFVTGAEENDAAFIERGTSNEERIEFTDVDEDNDVLLGVTRENPVAHPAGAEISFGEDDDLELVADGHELGGRTIEAVPIDPQLWMFFALGKRPFGQEYEVEVEVVDGEYSQIVTAPRGMVNTVPAAANPGQLGGAEIGDGLTPDPPGAAPIVKQGVSVNIIDMSAYMAQNQVQTGAPITDLGPGSFRVEAQMSDDEGVTWTDLAGAPGWTEVLRGGTIQVHADLVGEAPASDPPIRRQYRYRYRVEDLEGLVSDYSEAGAEQPGLTLTADWLEVLVLRATKIYSPDVTGWRLEIGDSNLPILYWDGITTNFSLDDAGNIFVTGNIRFGRGSLLTDDFVELAPQPLIYQDVTERQNNGIGYGPATGAGVKSISFFSDTLPGATLMLIATVFHSGTGTQTMSTPAGFTAVGGGNPQTGPGIRKFIFLRTSAPKYSAGQNISSTLSAGAYGVILDLVEFSGATIQDADVIFAGPGGLQFSTTTGELVNPTSETVFYAHATARREAETETPFVPEVVFDAPFTRRHQSTAVYGPSGQMWRARNADALYNVSTGAGRAVTMRSLYPISLIPKDAYQQVSLLVLRKKVPSANIQPAEPGTGNVRIYNSGSSVAIMDDAGNIRGVPILVGSYSAPGPSSTFSSGAAFYVNLSTHLLNITKQRASSDLLIMWGFDWFATSAALQGEATVSLNGTDQTANAFAKNNTQDHTFHSFQLRLSGVAAGAVAVRPRIRRSTGTFNHNDGGTLWMMVWEI
jgi:hypothetical protein